MKDYGKSCLYYIEAYPACETDYMNSLINYIEYYNYRSRNCKYFFYTLMIIKIVSFGVIPIMELAQLNGSSAIRISIVSFIGLLCETVQETFRLKEKWILYRNTGNRLMSEQRQYAVKKGKYSDLEDTFQHFVENIENIIDDEARKWDETVKKEKKAIKH